MPTASVNDESSKQGNGGLGPPPLQESAPREEWGALAYLLLTFAYIACGKLGLMLALPPGYSSPVFPPAGIAVAAAFIAGRRILPWIFLGALWLNIWVGYSASHQLGAQGTALAAIIAVASTLQATVGGWALRRAVGYPASFDHSGEIVRFLLLAPLICLTSASISVSGLAALGIVAADDFTANWASWWVGDTLGLLVMLPLVMVLAGRPRALWARRRVTVAVPVLLVFVLFVMIFLKANQWEYTDSLNDYRQLSHQAVNQVENKLGEQETVLNEMAALFIHDADGHVTRNEFHRFAQRSLARFPTIKALEWVVPVAANERASFEAEEGREVPGFEIREKSADGRMQRATARDEYYPVTYVEPPAGNESALGFDLASTPERRAALDAATRRGVVTATPPLRLVQENGQQAGMLLLLAVNPQNKKSGVVLSVLRMDDFMDKLLLDLRPMLSARLLDLDARQTLYDNFAGDAPAALYAQDFMFGTRHYRLETAPTPAYLLQHRGWQSWSVLAAGVLGTSLLGAMLLLGTGYTARIEREVEDRTRRLNESESRFRNILEDAPIGMTISTLDGRVMQVNHALCVMLGYSREELEKLSTREITHPDDIALTLAHLKPLQEGKLDSFRLEKRYLRKDGHVVWGQVAASLVRDSSGTPLYNIGQIEDITERRMAEQKLKDAEALWSFALEGAGDGVWDWDVASGKVTLSKAGAAMFGYEQSEAAHDIAEWYARLAAEDQARWSEMLDRFFRDKAERFSLEYPVRGKNGNTVWLLTRGMVVGRTADGKVSRMVGVHTDITRRKLAEEAMNKSAEEIEDLYNRAPCGYHSLDKDGVITRINDTELAWLGYTREEVVGKMKITDLLTPVSKEAFPKNFALFKKRGFLKDIENEMVCKDGSILYGLLNATLARDAAGEYLSSRSTTFDITERKKAEETLRTLLAALENSPIAVTITDADANIQYVSPRFSDLTGHAPGDVIGRNLRVMQAGQINNYAYLEMWNALSNGQPWHGELSNKSRQGHAYWEDIHITPVKSLAGAVTNYVAVSADISERKQAEEKMRHLATYDPLTDLPNRALVDDRLRQALTAAKRDKTNMALMFLDLDKFKPINDTLGHDVGDLLLKEVAVRMQECVRESDTIGRIGGDEFVVLLPAVDSDQHAVRVAEKIRQALNRPFYLAEQDLHIAASIGVALYPEHGDTPKTLFKHADTAMYYAKAAGRDNVQLYKADMTGV
jgi:diguanylate cyclase (GGDEF)-like protein/PAS domain S-box-containing protein